MRSIIPLSFCTLGALAAGPAIAGNDVFEVRCNVQIQENTTWCAEGLQAATLRFQQGDGSDDFSGTGRFSCADTHFEVILTGIGHGAEPDPEPTDGSQIKTGSTEQAKARLAGVNVYEATGSDTELQIWVSFFWDRVELSLLERSDETTQFDFSDCVQSDR